MNKKCLLGLIILHLIFISCVEDKKHIKNLKKHNPQQEISQTIKDIKAETLYQLALDSYQRKNYNESINLLKASLLIEKNPIIYNELGTVNSTLKNYDIAIEYYKEGQKSDSTYWPNFINEASIYLRLKEFDKAEQILEEVLRKSKSEYWTSYANLYLAFVYFNNGNQCNKAKEYLSKSKSLKNDYELKEMYEKFETKIKQYCS
jgi:tetratricopeptide (TPR) repeat protein